MTSIINTAIVPARQSVLRDFFVLPTFRAVANKKSEENVVVLRKKSIFAR